MGMGRESFSAANNFPTCLLPSLTMNGITCKMTSLRILFSICYQIHQIVSNFIIILENIQCANDQWVGNIHWPDPLAVIPRSKATPTSSSSMWSQIFGFFWSKHENKIIYINKSINPVSEKIDNYWQLPLIRSLY